MESSFYLSFILASFFLATPLLLVLPILVLVSSPVAATARTPPASGEMVVVVVSRSPLGLPAELSSLPEHGCCCCSSIAAEWAAVPNDERHSCFSAAGRADYCN